MLLTPEDLVTIIKEHNGDLVQMWETKVVEGTLTVDSCMNYVLKAQLKKVREWGDEDCTEHAVEARKSIRSGLEIIGRPPVYPRHDCYTCWQALIKEVE